MATAQPRGTAQQTQQDTKVADENTPDHISAARATETAKPKPPIINDFASI